MEQGTIYTVYITQCRLVSFVSKNEPKAPVGNKLRWQTF